MGKKTRKVAGEIKKPKTTKPMTISAETGQTASKEFAEKHPEKVVTLQVPIDKIRAAKAELALKLGEDAEFYNSSRAEIRDALQAGYSVARDGLTPDAHYAYLHRAVGNLLTRFIVENLDLGEKARESEEKTAKSGDGTANETENSAPAGESESKEAENTEKTDNSGETGAAE